MNSFKETELSELLKMIREDKASDEAFSELADRYLPLLKMHTSVYFGGIDPLEPMQEARIALHNAAMTYAPDKCDGVTFGLYASVCISNKLKSLIRKNKRHLDKTEQFADTDKVVSGVDVESYVVTRDVCDRVMNAARELLSDFEFEVFRMGFERYATKDIAQTLGKSTKSIENAKFRISQRLRKSKIICDILLNF